MKVEFRKGGRASAIVAVMAVLIMLAVPLTALHFDTENANASQLVQLSYDANGGDGGGGSFLPTASTFETGWSASEVKFDPLPTRSGYAFTGWNTATDGTGKWFRVTDPYNERFYSEKLGTTLYAQWAPVGLNIDLASESGTVRPLRLITWDGSDFVYEEGFAQPVVIPGGVIRFYGTAPETTSSTSSTLENTCIRLSGSFPQISDNPFYLVLDTVTITAYVNANDSDNRDMRNSVDIGPDAAAIVQLAGNSTIRNDGEVKAVLRVVGTGIFTGQGDSKLTVLKTTSEADVPAPGIGGDGRNINGSNGEDGGRMQFESGQYDIQLNNSLDAMRGTAIGGGGLDDGPTGYSAGSGGDIRIHGGSISTFQKTPASIYAAAIGGGGAGLNNCKGGDGGNILITGGEVQIEQTTTSNIYGPRGSGIGGGGTWNGRAGDSGKIDILGGDIKIIQGPKNVHATGIGAAAANSGNENAGSAAYPNYINIEGGNVTIEQTVDGGSNPLPGAAIGGSAGNSDNVKGGPADVTISGGNVTILKKNVATGTSASTGIRGTGIGGGASERAASHVVIDGGVVNISLTMASSNSKSPDRMGAAIGTNVDINSGTTVQINGGIINISRAYNGGTTEIGQAPVGQYGDFGKVPIINGGSIRLTNDSSFDSSGTLAPNDSQGNLLYRAKVYLDIADNPQSLFVRKTAFINQEFGTERYEDFHVQGRHIDLRGSGDYGYFNLYLPQTGQHELSVEVSSNGDVKTFQTQFNVDSNVAQQTNVGTAMYRVVYRLGDRLRFEEDTIHITGTVKFSNTIRATKNSVDDTVAPWSLSYVERHDIDCNNAILAKSVTSLDGDYAYFASEVPLKLAPVNVLNPAVSTSYGNIQFDEYVTGRLVITAEDAARVDVQYIDDYTYTLDPGIPATRYIERIFGEGYPISVGFAKDSDPDSGPWAQNDAPIAAPLPEPADVVWTSDPLTFEEWRLDNATLGTAYNTDDLYTIPDGSGDLVFHSVWGWKGKIYFTENGPGHIEYSLNNGQTWNTESAADANGVFFPVPLKTVNLKAMPDPASVFLQWGDSYGHAIGNDHDTSVTVTGADPGDEKYATAWFHAADDVYTLTADANGGSINIKLDSMPAFDYGSIPVNVPKGSQVVLQASHSLANFSYWEGTVSSSVNPLIISGFNGDHTEKAVFTEPGFGKLLIVNENGGSVAVGIGNTFFDYTDPIYFATGTSVVLTSAVSPAGSNFSYWSGDFLSAANPAPALTMNEGKVVNANYTGTDGGHLLTVYTGAGSVSVKLGTALFEYTGPVHITSNTDVELQSVSLPTGKTFSFWSGSVAGSSNPALFAMDDNKNITANYADTATGKTLAVVCNGGTVKVVLGTAEFDYTGSVFLEWNASVRLESVGQPSSGAKFSYWSGDVSDAVNPVPFSMDDNKNVMANYTGNDGGKALIVTITGNGTVNITVNGTTFPHPGIAISMATGVSVSLRAVPEALPGNEFVWWSGDLRGYINPQSFVMDTDKVAAALFSDSTYTVTATESGSGIGSIEYKQNGIWNSFVPGVALFVPNSLNLEVRAVADAGSSFLFWTKDLSGQESSGTIIANGVSKEIDAQFEFYADTVLIKFSVSGGSGWADYWQNNAYQTFPVSGELRVLKNADVKLQAAPDSGNAFVMWYVDGTPSFSDTADISAGTAGSAAVAVYSAGGIFKVAVAKDGDAAQSGTVEYSLDGSMWHVYTTTINVVSNASIKLRTAAGSGSTFVWWSGDLSGPGSEVDINSISVNKSITAWFFKNENVTAVTATVSGNGTGTVQFYQNDVWQDFPTGNALTVPKGALTVRADPGPNNVFIVWSGDLTDGVVQHDDLAVDSPKEIDAWFESASDTATVTATKSGQGDGKVQFDVGGTWHDFRPGVPQNVPKGNLNVKAAPIDAIVDVFLFWTGDLYGQSGGETLAVDTDKSIDAQFEHIADTVLINLTANEKKDSKGWAAYSQNNAYRTFPASGSLRVLKNSDWNLSADPASGSELVKWSVGMNEYFIPGILLSAGNSNVDVTIFFAVSGSSTKLHADMDGSGTGKVFYDDGSGEKEFPQDGIINVIKGTDISLRAGADSDSTFIWWSGGINGPVNPCHITNITQEMHVTAWIYEDADLFDVNVTYPGPGNGKVQFLQDGKWHDFIGNTQKVPKNSLLDVIAVPDANNSFIVWTGSLLNGNAGETLVADSSKNIGAWFEQTADTATVTATKSGQGDGKIQFDLGGTWHDFPSGSPQTVPKGNLNIRAVPASGDDTFLFWTGVLSGQTAAQTLNIDGNKNIDAQFEKIADTVLMDFGAVGDGWATYLQNGSEQTFPSGGELRVLKNTTLRLTAAPGAGSVLISWSVDGFPLFDNFVNVPAGTAGSAAVVTYSANGAFKVMVAKDGDAAQSGTVEYSLSSGAAWIAYTGPVTVSPGSSVDLRASAGSGNTFVWWSEDISGPVSPQTISNIGEDKKITAWFFKDENVTTVTATVSGSGSGKVQFSQNSVWQDFPAGNVLTVPKDFVLPVNAVPSVGQFFRWTGDLAGRNLTETITANSPKTVNAEFTKSPIFNLNLSAAAGGSVEYLDGTWKPFPSGGLAVIADTPVQARALADSGDHHFIWWTGDYEGVSDTPTITVSSDITAVAEFRFNDGPGGGTDTGFVLTARTDGTGTGEVKYRHGGVWYDVPNGGKWLSEGENINITAVPVAGVFYRWTGDLTSFSVNETILMDGNKDIISWFCANADDLVSVLVDRNGTGNGKVEYVFDSVMYEFSYGSATRLPKDVYSITAAADSGSTFVWWTGDLTTLSANETLNVSGSKSVTAWFFDENNVAEVTVSKDGTGNGTVSVQRDGVWHTLSYATVNVPKGTIDYKAEPSIGSTFVWWTGDLCGIEAQQSFNVTGSHTVTAWFYLNNDVTTAVADTVGTGSGKVQFLQNGMWQDFPIGSISVPKNCSFDVRAVAASGNFYQWKNDLSGYSSQETLYMGSGSGHITAEFVLGSIYTLNLSAANGGSVEYKDWSRGDVWTLFPSSGLPVPEGQQTEVRTSITDADYRFIWWTGDIEAFDSSVYENPTVTVGSDITASALFEYNDGAGGGPDSAYLLTSETGGTGSGKVQYLHGNVWYDVPSGGKWLPESENAELMAVTDTGVFYRWTGDLKSFSVSETLLIGGDKTVKAWFYKSTDLVNVTADRDGTGSGKVEYVFDGTLYEFTYGMATQMPAGSFSITATADSGNVFVWWTGDLTTLSANETLNLDGNRSLTAWFFGDSDAAEVTAEKDGTGSGTVSIQRDGVWHTLPYETVKVPKGSLTFGATAVGASTFYIWTGDLSGTQSPEDLDIDGSKSIKAWFYADSDLVNVTAAKEGDGKIEYEIGGTLVEFVYGTATKIPKGIYSVVATADSGSTFVWWTGDLTTLSSSETLDANGSKSIKAWFFGDSEISDLTVGKDGDGDGNVSVQRDGVWHALPYATVKVPDGSLTFRSMAAGGSVFVWWTGDLNGNAGQKNLVIDGNKMVSAWFCLSGSVTSVNASVAGKGTGHIMFEQGGGWHDFPSSLTVPKNHILSIHAVPTFGCFVEWIGAVTGANSRENFDVGISASTLTAKFDVDGKYITTIVSGSGSISPAGSVFVELGQDQMFTVTPESGAHIVDVIVNGMSYGPIGSYTFASVNSDHIIEVSFSSAPAGYTITGEAGDGVILKSGGSNLVPAEGNYTVSWAVVPGYEAKDVVIDGVSRPELAEAGSYTFLNVLSNHTISVTAEETGILFSIAITGGEGYAEYSLDGGNTFVRYTEVLRLEAGDNIIIRAVCASGYEFVRWNGNMSGTDETISITDIRDSVTETLILREKSGGGGSDDNVGPSMLTIAIAAILGLTLIGLLLVLLSVLRKRSVSVVMIDSNTASLIGNKRARKHRPYSFAVRGEGTVTYRTGENAVWKEPVRNGNEYEVPKEDVGDSLTIRVL
ncbi:MAG: InlB B-repeat-containing protein [Candidatus Methanoplasma sp.]|jgi:uncharacterized repeat protein (TIGR02543 family)|nr:InlB B-repeat-containing protein [Candidatus Methanoplasma sp.]